MHCLLLHDIFAGRMSLSGMQSSGLHCNQDQDYNPRLRPHPSSCGLNPGILF
ncbi:hypothetical protein T03_17997 [Trichinella britovi]|uniref:Uncharacterized protein n=1 Tax=Trichinella britovi TaxID=45882 RepID=A0A0V0YX62_TRIBR|nr:hypothetical protein T03_17997 [Trichinella britovi]